jgi:hypothetical protein
MNSHIKSLSLGRFLVTCGMVLFFWGCNEKGQPRLSGQSVSDQQVTATTDPVALQAAEEGSRAAIEEMLTLVKLESPQELAAHLAYKGADRSQHYLRAYDYNAEVEKVDVDKTYAKLQVLLLGMQTVDFHAFVQERESEATWNVWQLTLHYDDASTESVSMAMVEAMGEFLLGDIR